MNYINPPVNSPVNFTHSVFFSKLYGHEVGCNIYLPPEYMGNNNRFPVEYHLHGWTGNESSEIWALNPVCSKRKVITVFANSSPVIEQVEDLPVESMIIDELIPYIDTQYRTEAIQEKRSISGFSMGAGMAFMCAAKHHDLFSSVTAYAGTYHHYFHKGSDTAGAAPEKARGILEDMMREKRYQEEGNLGIGNILQVIRQNREEIYAGLQINIHVGTEDILYCDNEILHLYLDSLHIPHKYHLFEKAGHDLSKILL